MLQHGSTHEPPPGSPQEPTNEAVGASSVHIGRQPIFDSELNVVAYELLFRSAAQAQHVDLENLSAYADRATTNTILTAFSAFTPLDLLSGRPGFVNLTHAFLSGRLPIPFEPEQAVLEVLETVPIDREVKDGVRNLHENGYRIALDEFVWSEAAGDILPYISIVKIDTLTPWAEISHTIAECRRRQGADQELVLLATRVEDETMMQRCLDAGFTLFQGYHLGRPQTLSKVMLDGNRSTRLRLASKLWARDVSLSEIEKLIRQDPALVLQLLRIANAPTNGLRRSINSINDAVVILGLNKLQAWIVLLAMSGLSGRAADTSPALIRGRTCELLAKRCSMGSVDPNAAFAVGLLHGIAELLNTTPDDLLGSITPMSPNIQAALVDQPNPLHRMLRLVLEYEELQRSGNIDADALPEPQVCDVAACYLEALQWTTQSLMALSDAKN